MDFITEPDENGFVWRIQRSDDKHVRMVLQQSGDHTWIEIDALTKYPWYNSLIEWLSG
jgi:hypothetical protein